VFCRANYPAGAVHLVHALVVVLQVVVRQAAVQVAAQPGCQASEAEFREGLLVELA
jgi:hypothetical protein